MRTTSENRSNGLNRLLFVSLALLLAVPLISCGDEPLVQEERLTLRVFSRDGEGFPNSLDVFDVRVRVYRDSSELVQYEQLFDYRDPSGRLRTMEFGLNYQIVVEGIDEDGNILADGATPLFDYTATSGVREIQVFASALNTTDYASALYRSGNELISVPSEFEGPYVAADLGLGDEDLGGQRAGHAAIELPDGRVVVIGGARLTSSGGIGGSPFANFIDTVEIFDPFTGYWTLVRDSGAENVENIYENFVSPPMQLSVPRAFLTATYIGNYQILVVGGFFDAGDRIDPSTATEIIDLSKGTIETLDEGFAALQRARAMHTAHLVDGRVFIVGGVGGTYDRPSFQATQAAIEVYDPVAGYFDFALDPDGQQLSLLVPRGLHTGTSLPDGIVITGGRVETGATDTIEFFEFNSGAGELSRYVNDVANLPRLSSARFGHSAILMEPDFSLPSAEAYLGTLVAIVGGYTSAGESSDLLFGEGLTTSVQFFDTWELTTVSAYDTDLATARAYCQVAETSIMRDLLVMGGYTADGVTTTSERLMRTSEGGFPVEHVSFANFRQPRAFGSVSRINTHNILFVGGWDGGSSGVSCGQDTITAGCTSELANPGELYYLGYQYVD